MTIRNLSRHAKNLRARAEQLEAPRDLADRFGPYRDRPRAFVREVLGAAPQPYQVNLLEACSAEDRVAWRAAHGVGKTATLSWVLLWWLLTRPFSRVLIVAPAFERQVGRYLLPEVRRWVRGAPEPLPVEVRANSVEVEGYAREWFAVGVQATDAEKIEGAHADAVAVLADEAKGLPADVVAALHGTQTDTSGDRLYFLASTPGGPSGAFYSAFRSGVWRTFATSAEDSELVSRRWIRERRAEWGPGSPLYVARVLGEFPEQGEGTLFRLSDLERAVERETGEEDPAVVLGVDPARYGGDRSAVAVWRGRRLLGVQTRQGLSTMEVAAWASTIANRRRAVRIVVDEIGIGSGVLDRLRQMGHDEAVGVNVGSSSDRPKLHANKRAELAWNLREALERGDVSLPNDETLLSELSAFRYEYSQRGRVKLEAKTETKKRVGASPDLADAAMLGFAAASGAVGETGEGWLDSLTWGDSGVAETYRQRRAFKERYEAQKGGGGGLTL